MQGSVSVYEYYVIKQTSVSKVPEYRTDALTIMNRLKFADMALFDHLIIVQVSKKVPFSAIGLTEGIAIGQTCRCGIRRMRRRELSGDSIIGTVSRRHESFEVRSKASFRSFSSKL